MQYYTDSLACYLADEGPWSRQKIERVLLVARVFLRETVEACHAKGVGLRVMAQLAPLDRRFRSILVALAREGASLKALRFLEDEALACLDSQPRDLAPQQLTEVLERTLREALSQWPERVQADREAMDSLEEREAALLEREQAVAAQERALVEERAKLEMERRRWQGIMSEGAAAP